MDDDLTGKRIQKLRQARGLTQRALAQEASISYSLLTKIEEGDRDATQPVLAAIARELRVSANRLTGQPYDTEVPVDRIHELIPGLREP